MADFSFRLQNGGMKVTVIEPMNGGKVSIVAPGYRQEFDTLEELKAFAQESKFEINVKHLFGPSLLSEREEDGDVANHKSRVEGV